MQPVADFFPKGGAANGLFDTGLQITGESIDGGSPGNILKNGLGEWVRLLKNHSDAAPNLYRIDLASINVRTHIEDPSLHAHVGNEVVHPVEGPQQGALAATRGSDDRGDPMLRNGKRDFIDGGLVPIAYGHVNDIQDRPGLFG